jgi:hypothetical protein
MTRYDPDVTTRTEPEREPTQPAAKDTSEKPFWHLGRDDQRTLYITIVGGLVANVGLVLIVRLGLTEAHLLHRYEHSLEKVRPRVARSRVPSVHRPDCIGAARAVWMTLPGCRGYEQGRPGLTSSTIEILRPKMAEADSPRAAAKMSAMLILTVLCGPVESRTTKRARSSGRASLEVAQWG